jgi:hypothetical protein
MRLDSDEVVRHALVDLAEQCFVPGEALRPRPHSAIV